MDCSPQGSSLHWVSQARILKWVAISFSGGSSPPKDRTCVSGSRHHLSHQGNPWPNPPPVNSEVRNDSPHFLGISCKGVEYFAHCPSANKSYVDELGGAKRYEWLELGLSLFDHHILGTSLFMVAIDLVVIFAIWNIKPCWFQDETSWPFLDHLFMSLNTHAEKQRHNEFSH